MLLLSSETKSNKEVELSQIRKSEPEKWFRPRWMDQKNATNRKTENTDHAYQKD